LDHSLVCHVSLLRLSTPDKYRLTQIEHVKLGNAFSVRDVTTHAKLMKQLPEGHAQFRVVNVNGGHPYNELVVRGVVDIRYAVAGKRVYTNLLHRSRMSWDLEVGGRLTDMVVFLEAFTAGGLTNPPADLTIDQMPTDGHGTYSRGLWLLRPVGEGEGKGEEEEEEEFRLIHGSLVTERVAIALQDWSRKRALL
jgi:hypothetical protein